MFFSLNGCPLFVNYKLYLIESIVISISALFQNITKTCNVNSCHTILTYSLFFLDFYIYLMFICSKFSHCYFSFKSHASWTYLHLINKFFTHYSLLNLLLPSVSFSSAFLSSLVILPSRLRDLSQWLFLEHVFILCSIANNIRYSFLLIFPQFIITFLWKISRWELRIIKTEDVLKRSHAFQVLEDSH